MCVHLSLLFCLFFYCFCTYCLNRGWQGLKLNKAICLFPQTCPPEKKFSPSLWQSKGSGTSRRGSWNRPDSRQDYCEEEQKDTVKKARNILFILLISHTVCQSLSLMITYKHLPHHNKTPRANPGFQENGKFPKDSQLNVAGVHGDDSECVHVPWDNMNTVEYSHNHHTWYTRGVL